MEWNNLSIPKLQRLHRCIILWHCVLFDISNILECYLSGTGWTEISSHKHAESIIWLDDKQAEYTKVAFAGDIAKQSCYKKPWSKGQDRSGLWWCVFSVKIGHVRVTYTFFCVCLHDNELKNKANRRDLIAATGLIILLKFDSNRRFFQPVWPWNLMVDPPKNNRALFLCNFKLFASFCIHWWIQTGVTVWKRLIWVKIDDFFSPATLQFDGWP